MARFVQEYMLQGAPDACFGAIHQTLTQQGFKYTVYENEQLFQKGEGWIAAPTFFKISFGPDRVRVEAWLKYAILPGVFAGELGMTGFVGCAAKGPMKNCAELLDRILGGPAARIGCDPFLRNKNMNMTPRMAQPLPPQGYAPQQAPQGFAPQQQVPQGYAPQQQAPQGFTPQQPYMGQQTAVCRNCGAVLQPGNSFCGNCGAQNR